MVFQDRRQAGRLLAEQLGEYRGRKDTVVLAIPRGGVLVGAEIARELGVSLDVIVTKKIGAPGNEELAIGAVAEDGEPIFDEQLVKQLKIGDEYLERATKEVHKKIRDYIEKFRVGRGLDVYGKVVIVTDDGVATGATMEAALHWLRNKRNRQDIGKGRDVIGEGFGTKEIILAIPTGAEESMERLERLADKAVVLDKPGWFAAVGQFYREFEQVSDEEVRRILTAS